MRYSLRRAIHHEFWLRMNIQCDAPKLIIDDCKRLRDYWYNKLTEEEKEMLETEVQKRLSYFLTEEERLATIPSRGDKGKRMKVLEELQRRRLSKMKDKLICSKCGSMDLDLTVCPICGKIHKIVCRKCGYKLIGVFEK